MGKKTRQATKKDGLSRNLKLIIALCVLGIIFSSYLMFQHYSEEKDPFCDALGGGCNIVNKGPYSEIDGILMEMFGIYVNFPVPVSLIGLLGFAVTIVLSLFILKGKSLILGKKKLAHGQLIRIMFWLNLLGWFFALFLTYIEFVIMQTFCIYCDITKTTFTIVLIISWINLRYAGKK